MLNMVTLHGRVGVLRDTRHTHDGKTVQQFSLAVDTGRYADNGDWMGDTTWYEVVCFGPLADNVLASVDKGDQVTVTCRPSNDDYTLGGDDEEVIAAGFQPDDDRSRPSRPSRRINRTKWKADDVAVSLRRATADIARTAKRREDRVLAVA
jgi:single-strand DNA-binding protein